MELIPNHVPNDPERELLEKLKAGDPEGLGELYNLYFGWICQICRRYEAERDLVYDLTLDILIKAHQKIGSFEGNAKFSTWLYAIARNHCINFIEKRKNERVEPLDPTLINDEDNGSIEDAELRLENEMLLSQLDQCIRTLPASDQRMLAMKYYEAGSIRQLQEEFNLSASAVKMRLQRARLRLAQQIRFPAVA